MTLRSKPCPPRPEFYELVREAQAAFEALTPAQQRAHRRAQRRSWVIGNIGLSRPDLSREQLEAAVDAALADR